MIRYFWRISYGDGVFSPWRETTEADYRHCLDMWPGLSTKNPWVTYQAKRVISVGEF
jgi:hypothetical protein